MATQQRKTSDDDSQTKATGSSSTDSGAGNVVAAADGPEHGYVGEVHPDKDRDAYTVAGVTGSTAKAQDKSPSDAADNVRSKWKPLS